MSAISTFLNQIKTAIYGEQVRDAIHDSILQCYTDVTNGVTLAQNAASSAGRAATDANGAANSATAAAHNASTAASSANTAANTATAAANNASNAKEAANAAAQVATSAANQANDAATAANTAAQAANTAKTNADTATTAANTAATAANTAAGAANAAKDDAVAATEAATTAAETINDKGPSVVENVSGPIASFSDGADNVPVKNLVVNIEPVQDLHGYDHPWPAGGGKNILNITAGTTTNNGVTFTVNADKTITLSGIADETNNAVFRQNLSVSDFPSDTVILNGCPSGGNYYNAYSMALCDPRSGLISNKFDVGSGVEYSAEMLESVSQLQIIVRKGTNANGLVFKPMIRLATETDDTFVPYSNICPIEGWTGAKVTRTGKNLLDVGEYEIPNNSRTNVVWEGNLSGSFVLTADTNKITSVTHPEALFVYMTVNGVARGYVYNNLLAGINFSGTITKISIIGSAAYARAVGIVSLQLELGSTATDYESYQGQTLDISLPSEAGTVYGGTLDVASGVLTVDWVNIDLGTLDYKKGNALTVDTGYVYHCNLTDLGNSQNLLCSNRKTVTGSKAWESIRTSEIYKATITLIAPCNVQTAAEAKSALSGTQLVYKLATPLTYHLTPIQVKTLLGKNNIFADAGDVSVDYIADTKLYIDKKFTELQALVLENVGG